jgi:putative protease
MPKKSSEPKPIGTVTHFYGNLEVAIVKFNKGVAVGERVKFKGATTDFEEAIKSMQYDHQAIESAKKGQEVGIKVGDKVREGDLVYAAE